MCNDDNVAHNNDNTSDAKSDETEKADIPLGPSPGSRLLSRRRREAGLSCEGMDRVLIATPPLAGDACFIEPSVRL